MSSPPPAADDELEDPTAVFDFDIPFTKPEFWFEYAKSGMNISINCLVALLMFVIFSILVWLAVRVVRAIINNPKKPMDPAVAPFVISTLKLVLWVQIVPMIVTQIGIAVDSMIAVVSAIALAVGISLRPMVENFVMGMVVVIAKPFERGHQVRLASVKGKVTDILFSYTKLEQFDGNLIYIPNGKIFGGPIVNYSSNGKARIDVGPIGLDHKCDLGHARTQLVEALKPVAKVLQDPPPKMIVTDVTPSAVFISARVWVKPDDMGGAPFAVREAIIERFNRHGVPISHWRTAEVGKAIEQLDEAGVLPGLGASLDGSRADASGRVRKGAALEGSSEAADDEGIVLMAAQSLQSSI